MPTCAAHWTIRMPACRRPLSGSSATRGLPDALRLLVSLLDSRSIEVRDAARTSLTEFNFARYRAMFDLLDEKAVKTTGVLVHKVDHAVRDGLMQELGVAIDGGQAARH